MHYFTWKLELVSNILWVIVGSKIQLQQTILIFLGKIFPKKESFQSKTKKMNITIESFALELV